MTDSAPATGSGLFSMPTLQYNEEGWGPYEISETFRDMPYQVSELIAYIKSSIHLMATFFFLQSENRRINLINGRNRRFPEEIRFDV